MFFGSDEEYEEVPERFETVSEIADQLDESVEDGNFNPEVLERFVEGIPEDESGGFLVETVVGSSSSNNDVEEYERYGLMQAVQIGSEFPVRISTERGQLLAENPEIVESVNEIHRLSKKADPEDVRNSQQELGAGSADHESSLISQYRGKGMKEVVELTEKGEKVFETTEGADLEAAEEYLEAATQRQFSSEQKMEIIERKSIHERGRLREDVGKLVAEQRDSGDYRKAVEYFMRYVEVKQERDMNINDSEKNLYRGVQDIVKEGAYHQDEIIRQASQEIQNIL